MMTLKCPRCGDDWAYLLGARSVKCLGCLTIYDPVTSMAERSAPTELPPEPINTWRKIYGGKKRDENPDE